VLKIKEPGNVSTHCAARLLGKLVRMGVMNERKRCLSSFLHIIIRLKNIYRKKEKENEHGNGCIKGRL
jgi:hypothetical protein